MAATTPATAAAIRNGRRQGGFREKGFIWHLSTAATV